VSTAGDGKDACEALDGLMTSSNPADLSEFGERISTYKRTEADEIVDRMDLFGGDAAPIV